MSLNLPHTLSILQSFAFIDLVERVHPGQQAHALDAEEEPGAEEGDGVDVQEEGAE